MTPDGEPDCLGSDSSEAIVTSLVEKAPGEIGAVLWLVRFVKRHLRTIGAAKHDASEWMRIQLQNESYRSKLIEQQVLEAEQERELRRREADRLDTENAANSQATLLTAYAAVIAQLPESQRAAVAAAALRLERARDEAEEAGVRLIGIQETDRELVARDEASTSDAASATVLRSGGSSEPPERT